MFRAMGPSKLECGERYGRTCNRTRISRAKPARFPPAFDLELGSAKGRGSQWWKCTALQRPSAFAQSVFLDAIAQGLASGAERPRRRHDVMPMAFECGLDDVPVHVI